MRCYNCGSELPKGAKICVGCGQKVGERQQSAADDWVAHERKPNPAKRRSVSIFPLPWYYGLPLGVAGAVVLAILMMR